VAGIGGSLFAIYSQAALPDTYNVFTGLVLLAVLVPIGVRSNASALVAAAIYTYLPAIFLSYLPSSWAQVPTALFGLGAVMVARNPQGALEVHARQFRRLAGRLRKTGEAEELETEIVAPSIESPPAVSSPV
jgi:branched-chain amino acid transport system permease protein